MLLVGHCRSSISTHAPVKERPGGGVGCAEGQRISTHAPVKERPSIASLTASEWNFNSRSCEGATPHRFRAAAIPSQFQLTLL